MNRQLSFFSIKGGTLTLTLTSPDPAFISDSKSFRRNTEKHIFYLQGEPTKCVVFLISYWGDQIGQKVKKICDW